MPPSAQVGAAPAGTLPASSFPSLIVLVTRPRSPCLPPNHPVFSSRLPLPFSPRPPPSQHILIKTSLYRIESHGIKKKMRCRGAHSRRSHNSLWGKPRFPQMSISMITKDSHVRGDGQPHPGGTGWDKGDTSCLSPETCVSFVHRMLVNLPHGESSLISILKDLWIPSLLS